MNNNTKQLEQAAGMNVLSLFDGMSCGQIALQRAGLPVTNYFASEIDKYAIQVTMANWPNTVQLGSVVDVRADQLPKIDLLIGGSPCQGFSFAGKGLNFEDPRSKLFFEFVRLLKDCAPRYFLLENVKMPKSFQKVISDHLGCTPFKINSSLLSAQNRERLYWTNINFDKIDDKNINLIDFVNPDLPLTNKYLTPLDSHKSKVGLKCLAGISKNKQWLNDGKVLQRNFSQGERVYCVTGKSSTLSSNSGGTCGIGNALISFDIEKGYRKLTIDECEQLQTVPIGYTSSVERTQRHKMIGNGWTVDVIAHIFKSIAQ